MALDNKEGRPEQQNASSTKSTQRMLLMSRHKQAMAHVAVTSIESSCPTSVYNKSSVVFLPHLDTIHDNDRDAAMQNCVLHTS